MILPVNEGVTRPLRVDATEEGLETDPDPAVGVESLEDVMKTPQFGGHVKYRVLYEAVRQPYKRWDRWTPPRNSYRTHPLTEPSFLPLPAKPPPSSTPANSPDLPSISPRNRRVPSKPRDSIRTLSPTVNVLPARLELLANTSEARLAGRGAAGLEPVLLRAAELTAEDEEAAEFGRPATEALPENDMCEVGEREPLA